MERLKQKLSAIWLLLFTPQFILINIREDEEGAPHLKVILETDYDLEGVAYIVSTFSESLDMKAATDKVIKSKMEELEGLIEDQSAIEKWEIKSKDDE